MLPTLANLSLNQTAVVRTDATGDDEREVVLAAVALDGHALRNASEDLKNDREVVLAAVAQDANALMWASEALHNDREVVLTAVTQNGRVFLWASEELKNDREVVLAAVAEYGSALKFASDTLMEDRDFILLIVHNKPFALEHVSYELKNDREVVLAAVAQNGDALEYAVGALEDDSQIRLAAATANLNPSLTAMAAIINDIEAELKVLLRKTESVETDDMRSSRMDRLDAYAVVLGRLAAVQLQSVEPDGPAAQRLKELEDRVEQLIQSIEHPQNELHLRRAKRNLGYIVGDDDAKKRARTSAEALALSIGRSMRRLPVFVHLEAPEVV